jgi:hypothetical protein
MYFNQQHAFEIFAYFFLFTGCALILYYLISTKRHKNSTDENKDFKEKIIRDDARRS